MSINELKDKLVYSYNGILLNKNEQLIHALTRMNLKCIVLSERSTICSIYMTFRKGKSTGTESDQWWPGGGGGRREKEGK